MIDRVAGAMLGQLLPWPPSRRQLVHGGLVLLHVGTALGAWQYARKGGFTLRPWHLRLLAVSAGAMALWTLSSMKAELGITSAGPGFPMIPAPSSAGYGGGGWQ
ncbi:MAG: hypothetical protein Q8Q14_08540 [Gemmatimonadales bacterium]|nr:hypothetical protein [Gemmatimonadales bacterium]